MLKQITLILTITMLGAYGCPQGYPEPETVSNLLFSKSLEGQPPGGGGGGTATPGVTVNVGTTLISESGTSGSFTVNLNSQPTFDVTISLTVTDSGEATIDIPVPGSTAGTLTFTSANWNVAQTVTVTGVDDLLGDGNQNHTIALGVTTSADADYNGAFNPPDVLFTTTDDDTAGVTVSPPAPAASVAEGGATSSFDVVLNSEPAFNVTIPLSVSDTSEASLSAASLTFTSLNWNTPQTVTVTAIDDVEQDGSVGYNIIVETTQSLDAAYSGTFGPTSIAFTTTDNDAAGVSVSAVAPSSALSESGTNGSFTVVLDTEPTSDVTIPVSLSDVSEARIDLPFTGTSGNLVFTPANWNVPQTVTVTGIDDALQDGLVNYNLVLGATVSTDPVYSGTFDPADVAFSTSDDDTANVTIGAVTPSNILSESGTTAEFTVVLNSEPAADVTIAITSLDTSEASIVTPSSGSFTFTAANWNMPQTVVVKGVDDAVVDGAIIYDVEVGASASLDGTYNATFGPTNVGFTTTDDDGVVGVTVSTTGPLSVNETGTSASFTVVLDTEPTADVTIPVSTADNTEGTITAPFVSDSGTLTFTTLNWNIPQSVTVTGVDDAVVDGDTTFTITLGVAAGGDYAGIDPADVTVITNDDEVPTEPGVTVNVGTTTISESGTSGSFTVKLNSQPTVDVTIALTVNDATEATMDIPVPGSTAGTLTFTSANWNVAQTVTVTGVDDLLGDGNQNHSIALGVTTSADADYNGAFNPPDVLFTTTDDDTAGVTVSPPAPAASVAEGGATSSFDVVLNSEPAFDVTIPLSVSDTSEATLSAASLTFTSLNWNVPQTVTVTAVDDLEQDGAVGYNVIVETSQSADFAYSGTFGPTAIAFTTTDNDAAGVSISAVAPSNALSESGTSGSFTVVLDTEPTSDVTIPVSLSDVSEARIDLPFTGTSGNLVFAPANWNVPQTVTVTGLDDSVQDGLVNYNLVLGATVSTDPVYSGTFDPADVAFSTSDDDTANVTIGAVTPSNILSESGTTAEFTVVLNSEPAADVTIAITSLDTSEASIVTPASGSFTFTAANWNMPQTVVVKGVDDAVVDGAIIYDVEVGASASLDGTYNATFGPTNVGFTTTDDDGVVGVTVSTTGPLSVNETGTSASFTVVLDTEPTADVTIPISTSDNTEGTITAPFVADSGTLTFTTLNWNIPQSVTVSGVDDVVVDGDTTFAITLGAAAGGDYAGYDPADVSIITSDDDSIQEPGVTVNVGTTLISETGTSGSFTVKLNSQPTADVTISLTVNDSGEATMDIPVPGSTAGTLTFTSANWNVPQTVTVTGVDDLLDDSSQNHTIALGATASADPVYNATFDPPDVLFTTTDDDVAGVTVSPVAPAASVSENGTSASFDIVLNTEPSADVTITLLISDGSEATYTTPAVGNLIQLTFTPLDWMNPQTVTVTGVDDAFVDGAVGFVAILGTTNSLDPAYSSFDLADIPFTTTDNDAAGVSVSAVAPSSALSESGTSGSFTVVLDAQPISDVTIPLSVGDVTEARIDLPFTGASGNLTFSPFNWSVPQTVTVTGIDDAIQDGVVNYNIVLGATVSIDPVYNGTFDPADIAFSTSDDETAGVTVSAVSPGTALSEAGATAEFTVVLDSEPTADVTIAVSSDDASEGAIITPASGTLTFTSANWNMPQIISVQGVDDAINDGVQPFNVVLGATASADPNYSGTFDPADIGFTTSDDDGAPNVTVSTVGPLSVSETGTSVNFTVVLDTEPTADVTIPISTSDNTEGTITAPFVADSGSITFTTANWNVPQTITVTGVDDTIADYDVTFTITLGVIGGFSDYNGVDPADVTIITADDDSVTTPGITVLPTSGHITSEFGLPSTFSVVLNSLPSANVTMTVVSSNTNEGTVSTALLTFTPANWSVPQDVIITGVDDVATPVVDGVVGYNVTLDPSGSTDPDYAAMAPILVGAANIDNDAAGVSVVAAPLSVTEAGTTDAYSMVLNTQPSAGVKICLASAVTAEVSLVIGGDVAAPDVDCLQGSVSFTTLDWNVPKTITLLGNDDFIADGSQVVAIDVPLIVSGDADYSGLLLAPLSVNVTNVDDDSAGVTVVGGPLALSEATIGTTGNFTVQLNSEPTSDVKVCLFSTDTSEAYILTSGDVQPGDVDCPVAYLLFTSVNYSIPQTVTIKPKDDLVDDGTQNFLIVTSVVSLDPVYNTINPNDVSGSVADNDAGAGVTVSPVSGLTTSETPSSDDFSIVLTSMPDFPVKICLASSDNSVATIVTGGSVLGPDVDCSEARVEFDISNWNIPVTVNVLGVDDGFFLGDRAFTITTTMVTLDASYQLIDPSDPTGTTKEKLNYALATDPIQGSLTHDACTTSGTQDDILFVQLESLNQTTLRITADIIPSSGGYTTTSGIHLKFFFHDEALGTFTEIYSNLMTPFMFTPDVINTYVYDYTLPPTITEGQYYIRAALIDRDSGTDQMVGSCASGSSGTGPSVSRGYDNADVGFTIVGVYQFTGIQSNLPAAALTGWTECYRGTYNISGVSLAGTILANCNKANLLLACSTTADPSNLIVAANAPYADVTFDVGTGSTAFHNANGVSWYYSPVYSWGFFEPGDTISRSSCDTAAGAFPSRKLCWHTSGGNISGGYECGGTKGLNGSTAYERVIFHADF